MSEMTTPDGLNWGGTEPDKESWAIYLLKYGFVLVWGIRPEVAA